MSMLNDYEIIMIFTPVLSQPDFKKQQKRYSDFIIKHHGKVVHSTSWGLKSLAYPIQKKTTGLYFILEFQAPGETIAPLKVQLKRDETLLRHMITKLDKYAVEYNAKKRTPVKDKEQVAEPTE